MIFLNDSNKGCLAMDCAALPKTNKLTTMAKYTGLLNGTTAFTLLIL